MADSKYSSDYLSFYLGNYFTHVATVKTYPGESIKSTLKALVLALLFPASGSARGLTAIVRCAVLQRTPLQKAARSGALCMVVRSAEWRPPQPQEGSAIGTDFPMNGIIVRNKAKEESPGTSFYHFKFSESRT